MTNLIFCWFLIIGTVKPQHDVDGRQTYTINSIAVEHAYRGEVLQWIETGSFQYDETLEDKVLPHHKISLKD
jgi:hypothetical protein